jgi:steroid delta-isomerase
MGFEKMTVSKFSRATDSYIKAIQGLEIENLDVFFTLTSEQIEFLDPFNHTRGQAPMRRVFEEMFEKLENVSFHINSHLSDEETGYLYLHWSFSADNRWTSKMEFNGMSRVHINQDGLVDAHLDYWDAASEVYEKVPLIGTTLRALKSGLRVKQGQI